MPEEIKDLIEKIKQEGIKAAEEKAWQIELEAQTKATELLNAAKLQADKLIAEAKEKIAGDEEKQKILLAQAARDTLLSLKKEINSILERILLEEMQQVLTSDYLAKILSELLKGYSAQAADIVVLLKKEDREILEKSFLTKLKEETKKGITLRASEEISGGFTISFDSGKSCYDFTDKSLAEYIGNYLKPKLNGLLKKAVLDNKTS